MPQYASCPHCNAIVRLSANEATYCRDCWHRADVPQNACDCSLCRHIAARTAGVDVVAMPSTSLLAMALQKQRPLDRAIVIRGLHERMQDASYSPEHRGKLVELLGQIETRH